MPETKLRTVQAIMMGSDITLKSFDASAETLKKALQLIKHYERTLSANHNDSGLMKMNQMAGIAPVIVSPDMFELIKIAKEASLMPNTLFNFAIGPLVKLWKIGFSGNTIPTQTCIESTLHLCDPNLVILNHETHSVFLAKAGMQIDLGAIAKGYIADMVRSYFQSQQVKTALIDLGGNIHSLMLPNTFHSPNPIAIDEYEDTNCQGSDKDTALWRVGLRTPFSDKNTMLGALAIKNESVVTTGIYERFFIHNHQHYHHILSSQTGFPHNNDLVSVTVITQSSTEAEIWSTVLYGLGLAKGFETVKNTPSIEAVFITRDNQIVLSDPAKICFELFNQNFQLS